MICEVAPVWEDWIPGMKMTMKKPPSIKEYSEVILSNHLMQVVS